MYLVDTNVVSAGAPSRLEPANTRRSRQPPEPLAAEPRDGLRRGKERAALYAENLADLAAVIAFGVGTKSLHTRGQMAQLLWAMMQEVPDSIPFPPEIGRDGKV